MRRKLCVLGAVVLVLLSIAGVGAITSVTVSEYTSDQDFNDDSVDTFNLTVNGTGDSATLDAQTWNEGTEETIGEESGGEGDRAQNGFVFSPTERITGFELTLDPSAGGNRMLVVNHDTGETIKTYSIDTETDPTHIRVEHVFDEDTEYRVVFDSDGELFNAINRGPAPVSGDGFSITHGYHDGSEVSTIYSVATMQVLRGGESATYQAVHDESAAHTGIIDVAQMTNATATAEYQVPDGAGGWTTIDTTTISSAGETTTSLSETTGGQYRVVVHAENDGAYQEDWTFSLGSDRLEGERNSPEVTAERPNDGEEITSDTVELAANVSDADFSEAWGDNVTVRFYGNGEEVHNETVTSPQQVTYQWDDVALGKNEWYVEVEDDYGLSDQTPTSEFSTPSELRIYNESDTDQLIDGSVEVEVLFFGEEEVYTRTTTDGTVDLSGLPAGERFTVEISPDSDYHGRTVIIDSIYVQQDIYLLPTSANSVETRFVLDDPTGEYDSETILYIEKPIDRNGSVRYETIYADEFGSEGATAELEQGARYNLRIEATSGTSQNIGPYRASTSETVQVRPGSPTIELGDYEEGWAATAKVIEPSDGDHKIEYLYEDPQGLTDRVDVTIYEKNNASNQLVPTQTYTDLGTASAIVDLDDNQSEKTWVVEFDVERDGESFTSTEEVSKLRDLTGGLGDGWRLLVGIGIMFVSAGVFSMLNSGVGGVVVAIEGGVLWYTGWLSGATSAAGVVIALFIAVIIHIYQTSGP